MSIEARKFLDLDMVVQQIPHPHDRDLFQEAVNCYYAGSHRAAAILAWYATANCLKRRILELKEDGDGVAGQEAEKLNEGEGAIGEEEVLISSARKCELIDDFEEKSLRFARDMRNKCAHPTGIVPPAEAIRHGLFISSQYVLCRKGYRGIAYIRDVVTTQFDDIHFLPTPLMAADHCREIIERVTPYLRSQFVKLAAKERGKAQSEMWRKNAYAFFRQLIESADDALINELADSLKAFEPESGDFFNELAGIDQRVAKHLSHQKRSQIRSRLRQSNALKLRTDEETTHSWATFCALDGFEDEDLAILRERFQYLAKPLSKEGQLFEAQRPSILVVIADLLTDDTTSSDTARGCLHLFPTSLFDYDEANETSRDAVEVIVEEIIRRFVRDERHYALLGSVKFWHSKLIVQLLERSALYWTECSEDRPDDVALPFDARDELISRNPMAIPLAFANAVADILSGRMRKEWKSEESEAGEIFRSRLTDSDYDEAGAKAPLGEGVMVDDYWRSKLGVDISPTQVNILVLTAEQQGVTAEQVAGNLSIPIDKAKQEIEYLVLQALLISEDGRYILREDLRPLITSAESQTTE